MHPRTTILLVALMGAGCPASPPEPAETKREPPAAAPNDPRVAQEGEDLYAKETLERAQRGEAFEPVPGRGSGESDESNGVCRLFSPKQPTPECCKSPYGFDVEAVKKACGYTLYLGESFQDGSCGYYFHREAPRPAYFRMRFLPQPTAKDASESHANKLRHQLKEPSFGATPIPGVPGAFWSTKEGLVWAFVPGWSKVRQFTWRDSFCQKEKVIEVLKQVVKAKQPERGAPRVGLVPKARM